MVTIKRFGISYQVDPSNVYKSENLTSIFREEVPKALAGFHAVHFGVIGILEMLVFEEGRKTGATEQKLLEIIIILATKFQFNPATGSVSGTGQPVISRHSFL